jgi:hypothetical protein
MLGYDSEAELLTLDLGNDVYVDPDVRERVMASASAGPSKEQEV